MRICSTPVASAGRDPIHCEPTHCDSTPIRIAEARLVSGTRRRQPPDEVMA